MQWLLRQRKLFMDRICGSMLSDEPLSAVLLLPMAWGDRRSALALVQGRFILHGELLGLVQNPAPWLCQWNLKTGHCTRSVLLEPMRGDAPDPLLRLTFSPDGQLLAALDIAGVLRVWELPSGEPIANRWDQPGVATALAFYPDRRWLIPESAMACESAQSAPSRRPVFCARRRSSAFSFRRTGRPRSASPLKSLSGSRGIQTTGLGLASIRSSGGGARRGSPRFPPTAR